MQRLVTVLGRPLALTTLDDVVAVRGASARSPAAPREARGVGRARLAPWRLARVTAALRRAARGGPIPAGLVAVREVHVTDAGNVLLGDGRVTVKLQGDPSPAEARAVLRGDRLAASFALPLPGVLEVRTIGAESALDAAARLSSSTRYRFVEPVFEEILAPRWRPPDDNVGYARQWQWRNDGEGGGVAGADARIEPAWDASRGRGRDGRPVRIAVIDTGFDLEHAALADAFTDAVHYRYVAHGPPRLVPHRPGAYFPPGGHGTACAGLAAGRSVGVHGCGAAPEATLVPIACMHGDTVTQTSIALALLHAAFPHEQDATRSREHGADVITCSLGSLGPTWLLTSVLDEALQRVATEGRRGLGIPVFWAVGNDDVPLATDGVATHATVVAVGASDRHDVRAPGAHGPRLGMLAPGVDVATALPGDAFGALSGASFAAPIAAGVAALVLAENPGLTARALRERLHASCDRIGDAPYSPSGRNDTYGAGRINAERAVGLANAAGATHPRCGSTV